MAKTLPSSAYSVDGRVVVTKADGEEIKGVVKEIIGGKNDLLLILPEGAEEGEEKRYRAERVRKARGPAPGTKRGPNKGTAAQTSKEVDEDEDDAGSASDDDTGSDIEPAEMSLETLREFSNALEQMKTVIDAAILFRKQNKPQTSAKPALGLKSGGKPAKRPMAEDEDE